ncbi:TPA: P44/Msp2 family outer membrane protein [Enterococcus faecium]|uniref:Msp4/OMP-like domain-containing protein n=1 Tax=Enterococcus faecium TaxID=1352 RepID=A0AB73TP30_ENTFC|nr:P44/Msp2 family outer membrane protein [Enterococcus gallinarum]MCZ2051077.1 P44/Msp2 family outer membrane protein [Enterococcus faecium]MCZ2160240.1 P44/Msp2 family outer membrane protein [Enterococcus faecium]MCZ2286319.1 P44/Msp2 family outer membrane protein [Enterococcus faecium]MCZ2350772.1 P44/Msp2 family outer membrane protein [Enterococcus faecium]
MLRYVSSDISNNSASSFCLYPQNLRYFLTGESNLTTSSFFVFTNDRIAFISLSVNTYPSFFVDSIPFLCYITVGGI